LTEAHFSDMLPKNQFKKSVDDRYDENGMPVIYDEGKLLNDFSLLSHEGRVEPNQKQSYQLEKCLPRK